MTITPKARRAMHTDFLLTAAHTLRHYGRPELGDELADLAAKIRDGSVGPVSVVSDNELST
jgi:hypothetical protein